MLKTRADLAAAIAAYDELVERALDIVQQAAYPVSVENDSCARLSIKDGEAFLRWIEHDHGEYDSGGWCREKAISFPLELLLMTEDEVRGLQAQEKTERRRREAETMVAVAKKQQEWEEAKDRVEYQRLKAKYGG